MIRVLVLADSHVNGDPYTKLAPVVWDVARSADAIVHAGDVTNDATLDALATCAPLYAVLGNNDTTLGRRLPESLEVDLDGVRIAVVHETGATKGRAARVHRRFPTAHLVVYGHSHRPDDSEGVDGQRLFNPGSPTQRRLAPHRTFGIIELQSGAIADHQILVID
ncbi:MAG: metallophosphoesterase family protein [Acidimicrobiia bacterium]